MSSLKRLKNRALARLATQVPAIAQRFVAGYQAQESSGGIPWTVPAKPLDQAKLALVTTSGIHHRQQEPFDMNDANGDPSYRQLNGEKIFDDFQITHDYYDHTDAGKDPNIILPLDRVRELVRERIVGSLAQNHYSFMGHIDGPHITTLVEKTAQEVAQKLIVDQVDLVLLTPA
ncbi:glycine/sarcosine/betaine reductase selenoprotein B family protein [Malonomonas rubra]|uniref:glycine/sarcosine/betaine reductase selenoprotein B family protein n=1 Tax=Malonomonas rubra TaxID=57040 RepID=UPI0026EDE07F|nr:glycine/sarcosine/betaine reductase selenoprotein B family protein [Malonomonas rubra]